MESAGKKDSMASAERVMLTGVPKTMVVLRTVRRNMDGPGAQGDGDSGHGAAGGMAATLRLAREQAPGRHVGRIWHR